jgi:hypothetical protein
MSTKLTARRRYLPKVTQGYEKFSALLSNPNKVDLDTYVINELPGLKRVMILYGASLRRGETPDETSRAAEKLTLQFTHAVENAATSNGNLKDLLGKCLGVLDEYIAFAKIELPK